MRGTDGESIIAALPVKRRDICIFRLDPFRPIALQVTDEVCDPESASKSAEQMHVIFHATDDE